MIKKFLVLFIAVVQLCCFVASAENDNFVTDSINLEDVHVVADRIQIQYAYGNSQTISKKDMEFWGNSSLSELLNRIGNYNLSSYGLAGSLATLSVRGAGGSRTLATWNGLPINSLTTGSMDLSMIPGNSFSSITINSSANGSAYGSGALGGAIDLKSKAFFNKKSVFQNFEVGSFNTINNATGFNIGNAKVAYNGNLSIQHSKGNFSYFDQYYGKEMKRKNAGYLNKGYIHTLSWRPSYATLITISNWLQSKDLNLAAPNGSNPKNLEKEYDDHFYLYGDIIHCFNKISIKGKFAFLQKELSYWKKNAQTLVKYDTSEIKTSQYIADINTDITLSDKFRLQMGTVFKSDKAETYKYAKDQTEKSISVIPTLSYHNNNLNISISERCEWNSFYNPNPTTSVGYSYKIPNSYYAIKGNFGSKYNNPTYNDKYWKGMGRDSIKAEYGYNFEYGLSATNKPIADGLSLDYNITYFFIQMNDMIKWLPQGGTIWQPYNFTQVTSKGYEVDATVRGKFNTIKFNIFTSIHYTNAKFSKDDNVLNHYKKEDVVPYSPKLRAQLNSTFTVPFNVSFSIIHNFKSSMLNQDDREIPYLYRLNLSINYKILNRYNINAKAINVTNQKFELIDGYPQPGTSFIAGITIKLNK